MARIPLLGRVKGLALRGLGGFTLVELLLVVVVTTLGFVALHQMQMATLRGLANAKHIAEATNLGENFIEQLRLEFMAWTELPGEGLDDPAKFPHLKDLVTGAAAGVGAQTTGNVTNATGWLIASEAGTDRRVNRAGPPHVLGFNQGIRQAMVQKGFEGTDRPYCMHYRLTWLIPDRAIRAEVEVSWPMAQANMEAFARCENIAAGRLSEVRSITLNSSLVINVFQR